MESEEGVLEKTSLISPPQVQWKHVQQRKMPVYSTSYISFIYTLAFGVTPFAHELRGHFPCQTPKQHRAREMFGVQSDLETICMGSSRERCLVFNRS